MDQTATTCTFNGALQHMKEVPCQAKNISNIMLDKYTSVVSLETVVGCSLVPTFPFESLVIKGHVSSARKSKSIKLKKY